MKKQEQPSEFAKGVSVKAQETKFGDIIKLGVNVEQFLENEPNEAGFINIEIKKSKAGKMYAVLASNLNK
nr:MAG TPA: hypothetical protein [Herelleviridae sp.]